MTIAKDIEELKKQNIPSLVLVQGSEKYLIEQVEEAIIEGVFQGEIDEFSFGRFDMENVSIDAALEEALSMPFFSDYRVIFIDNPYFLTSQKSKSDINHDLDWFLEYIEAPSEYTKFVIVAPYDSLDKRKKINKSLLKNAHIISTEPLEAKDNEKILLNYLSEKGYHMSPKALELFLELTDNDLSKIMNELDKIFIYKGKDKKIEEEDVSALVPRSLNQNIFALNEAVLNQDIKKSLEVYHDLLLQKETPVNLLATMISQFRLFLQVKILRAKGYQQYDIQRTLKVHKYRVYLALKKEKQFSQKALMTALEKLIETDYLIKSGQADPKMQLELFIIRYCSKNMSGN
ncbi:MAG: DNA polymerase III subunit delta [Atopococcus tabaci]|uniref:DNA polymerase III subunit delta n=1 Tax=Atopococcus tabaci TaxID=269774 RepID=A0AA43UA59_9LACT|nr:DNA polymerase III subunit delta [Atopococcus tabaci]